MSEIEKAIEILSETSFCDSAFGHGKCTYNSTGCSDCEITRAKIIISKSLEKQIPKKVEYPERNYSGLLVAQCPRCGNRDIAFEKSYCSKCSQKLDWSENDG